MVETLLSPTRIKLYGRVVTELLLLKLSDIAAGASDTAQAANRALGPNATPSTILVAVLAYANAQIGAARQTGALGVAAAVATIVQSIHAPDVHDTATNQRVVDEAFRYARQ
jgi:hypothetical protein